MNLLAHAYLARRSDEWIVGAILGDFIKGSVPDGYPPVIQQSVRLHRRIDSFTDAHPIPRESRQLVHASRRRYAGIMIDIFYDHFLARQWSVFSPLPLPTFTQRIYRALQSQAIFLPTTLHAVLPRLIAHDRLASYLDINAVHATLHVTGQRFRRPVDLGAGVADLLGNYLELERHFQEYFPTLSRFTDEQITDWMTTNSDAADKLTP
jgi:acyl carrier protein phosphodiesterase